MATVHKRLDIFTLQQEAKCRAYGKAYTLAGEVRIEVGTHAVHMTTEEACTLLFQLQAAVNRLHGID